MKNESTGPQAELISFLETFPLYRKLDFPEPGVPDDPSAGSRRSFPSRQLPTPSGFGLPGVLRIEMPCVPSCGEVRTFESTYQDRALGRLLVGGQEVEVLQPGRTHHLTFICTHCRERSLSFLLYVDQISEGKGNGFSLTKAGQWPSARPKVDRAVARALGESAAPLYEKGLTSEEHNFGIGAFAYYRRVVEDTIDKILTDLRAYAENTGAGDLVMALDGVKHETQASKRIAAAKELLPPALCPNGLNPLGTIYQAVSDGLHGRDDEHCLELAENLRTALNFLVTTMDGQRAATEQYVAAVRQLQKVARKKATPG